MARGSSDTIERLARASRPAKAMIMLVVLAALGAVYYFFFYSDLSQSVADLGAKKKSLDSQVGQLTKRLTEYEQLRKDKDEAEKKRGDINDEAPQSPEIPAFYQHLETQASSANVKLLSHTLGKESAFDIFMKVPVQMELEGTFYEITHYFQLLGDSKTTKRVITIQDVSLSGPKKEGDDIILHAKFAAVAFRQAGELTPTSVTPGAPKAAPAASAAPASSAAGSSTKAGVK
jgi:Tfp pilus assembly protein PilO